MTDIKKARTKHQQDLGSAAMQAREERLSGRRPTLMEPGVRDTKKVGQMATDPQKVGLIRGLRRRANQRLDREEKRRSVSPTTKQRIARQQTAEVNRNINTEIARANKADLGEEVSNLEKWQPKHKVPTARNRKAREGYMNIGHHAGRQNLAHGVVEQMEKGDSTMTTPEEQVRLDNTIVQLEKIAGLGGAAKKIGSAVSGAAKKLGGGGDAPKAEAPKANFYDTAKVSRGKADSRDWKVQSTPATMTGPYGSAYERARTDVTEKQRAQRTGDPERKTPIGAFGGQVSARNRAEGKRKSGGSRLARAFGATKRAAKEFGGGFREGLGGGSTQRNRAEARPTPSAAQWHRYSQRGSGNKAANPYGDAASRSTKPSPPKQSAKQATEAAGLHYAPKMQKAMVSLQKFLDNDCGCEGDTQIEKAPKLPNWGLSTGGHKKGMPEHQKKIASGVPWGPFAARNRRMESRRRSKLRRQEEAAKLTANNPSVSISSERDAQRADD